MTKGDLCRRHCPFGKTDAPEKMTEHHKCPQLSRLRCLRDPGACRGSHADIADPAGVWWGQDREGRRADLCREVEGSRHRTAPELTPQGESEVTKTQDSREVWQHQRLCTSRSLTSVSTMLVSSLFSLDPRHIRLHSGLQVTHIVIVPILVSSEDLRPNTSEEQTWDDRNRTESTVQPTNQSKS